MLDIHREIVFVLPRTPEKAYYSRLRSAFTSSNMMPHVPSTGSYSRLNDNDIPLALMIQQQPDPMEQSKHDLSISDEFYSDVMPDDFILVEVVR
jgi:hypothetical protein